MLEKVIEDEKMKRMELNEKINVLVAELDREENVREKAEIEARNLRDEVDRLKGKLEKVRKRKGISFMPKNRVEGGRSEFGIGQVILDNVRAKSKEGTGKQCEWIMVKGGRS